MIKATELRIGNITNSGIVREISEKGVLMDCPAKLEDGSVMIHEGEECYIECFLGFDEFDGITLTEEWLVRFGFDMSKIKINDIWEYILPKNNCNFARPKIEFVHQLQNVIFYLTGEEITLKQKKIGGCIPINYNAEPNYIDFNPKDFQLNGNFDLHKLINSVNMYGGMSGKNFTPLNFRIYRLIDNAELHRIEWNL